MRIKGEHICRLCLKVAEYGFVIDEIVKQMLEILLLKVDLDITRVPIICQDCMEGAKKGLHFKLSCIHIEHVILSYVSDKIEAKHNIKVVYEQWNKTRTVFNEDFKICRFCMTQSEGNNFVSLDILRNECVFELLPQFMTEMDFNAIENPLVCTNCRGSLERYFKFVLNGLGVSRMKVDVFLPKKYEETKSNIISLDTRSHNNEEYIDQENVQANIADERNRSEKFKNYLTINSDAAEASMHEDISCASKVKQHVLKNHTRLFKRTSEPEEKSRVNRPTNNILDSQSYVTVDRDVLKIKMHKCSLCAYKSKYKSNLSSHMIVHKDISEVKLHKCSLCAFYTKRRATLKFHMLVHKDVSEIKLYKCSSCAYKSKDKSNLNRHMIIHKDISEVKVHKCSLCPFNTKRRATLKIHMLVHKDVSEIELYKCSLCAHETRYKSSLKSHMLLHKDVSEIETYKCLWCAYEAKHRWSLVSHMLVHKDISEIKMYNCALCAYGTKYKGSLIRHMSVHKNLTDVKMDKC